MGKQYIISEHDMLPTELSDKIDKMVKNQAGSFGWAGKEGAKKYGYILNKDTEKPIFFITKNLIQENEKDVRKWCASYVVGAWWLNSDTTLIINTKKDLGNLDFISMFMTCLRGGISTEDFSKTYNIDFDGERIENVEMANTVLDPLLLCHFLNLVEKIIKGGLKKGYIYHSENLKKCRGRINIYKNEQKNIMPGRADKFYCDYTEYGVNVPENKIIKRALIISKSILSKVKSSRNHSLYLIINRCLKEFEEVNDNISIKEIENYKSNKLFKDYFETIVLAKQILKRSGYTLVAAQKNQNRIPPFWIDMPTLFEYYLFALMKTEFSDNIMCQDQYEKGFCFGWRPDFLLRDEINPAILDAKYIPNLKGNYEKLSGYVRQLSGYARLEEIRNIINVDSDSVVPCILLYPPSAEMEEYEMALTSFNNLVLDKETLEIYKVDEVLDFYLIPIKLPRIG